MLDIPLSAAIETLSFYPRDFALPHLPLLLPAAILRATHTGKNCRQLQKKTEQNYYSNNIRQFITAILPRSW